MFSENQLALEKQQAYEWKLNAPFVQDEIAKWTIDGRDVYNPEGKYVNNFKSERDAERYVETKAINSFAWD